MKSINFIFGCHSHQPVGNFGFVFEDAYQRAYVPFINVLERFPAVRVTLHYTGPLWDWMLQHHPDYIERISALVRAGQVEIMGGAYYEPLICAIPRRDALAQIRRMHTFCETHFGSKPRGMWLAERVWEPHMASLMAEADVEYTALDDAHFLCSGIAPEHMFGYYMTEDSGRTVKVFPILERLRYLIPFHPVEETIEWLREHATEDGLRCAVIHDDGEKFGTWPGTYHSVYEEGWLEQFFQALTDNRDWLRSTTYSAYIDQAYSLGRTYLTCASYQEMMAWALPTPIQRELYAVQKELKAEPDKERRYGQFIRGSYWRNFLAKYDEANNIQKRMMRVSDRLDRLKRKRPAKVSSHSEWKPSGDETFLPPEQLAAASVTIDSVEKLLHESQCNCAYWHGVFGGLYLNHLRTALYEKFIEADKALDLLEGKRGAWVAVSSNDFDGDGNTEVVLENDRLCLFFSPADGGTLFELDYKNRPFNFTNTLTRRDEPYHDLLREGRAQVVTGEPVEGSIHELVQAKEPGLEHFLIYDTYRRASLRDHVLSGLACADDLRRGQYSRQNAFTSARYSVAHDDHSLTLRTSIAGSPQSKFSGSVAKTVTLEPGASSLEIRYDVTCDGIGSDMVFGVEFGINLLAGNAPDRYYFSNARALEQTALNAIQTDEALPELGLRDEWIGLEIYFSFSPVAKVHRYPIETVSQSEGGQERVYQGSVLVPCWKLETESPTNLSFIIKVEVREWTHDSVPTT